MNNQLSIILRRLPRWTMLAAVLLVLVAVIAGCAGPGGGKPLIEEQFLQLGQDMVSIENETDLGALEDLADQYIRDARAAESAKEKDKLEAGRLYFLAGYTLEYRETLKREDPTEGNYSEARTNYTASSKSGSPYGMQANYRNGVLGALGLLGADSSKTAKSSLNLLTHNFSKTGSRFDLWVRASEPASIPSDRITETAIAGVGGTATLVPEAGETGAAGPVLQRHDMADTALRQLDTIYATGSGLDTTYYKAIDAIVGFFRGFAQGDQSVAVVLMLFLLALLIKLVTAPLTTMAYRGMRDMQRVQPLLKEIQEKYKDDRAKLAEEQMKLMKEHKVSPMSGCLPMLIQLPIFIAVYRAVTVYAFQFSNAGFIWIDNLARPDLILLILYAISMILTQKLTATPAADPQQKMLQNQMTYMMPIFLVMVLYSMASAFLLYWFFLNVMSSAHQYYLLRKFKAEDVVRDAAKPAPAPAPGTPAKRRKKGTK